MAVSFNSEDKSYSNETTTLKLQNGAYEISDIDQLKLFRDAVNDEGYDFKGETVKLTTSIDLKNEEWTPIGKTGATFLGTFDGNGQTVSNLYINTPDDVCVGFFNDTDSATTIKNLTINNVNISGDNYAGAIVGYGYLGKISNCNVTGTIKISGRWFVGGISGHGYAAVDSCEVIAEEGSESFIKGSAGYVGGIFGYRAEDTSISNCTVSNITISGTSWGIGGISGIAQYGSVIEGCTVENTTITATDLNGDNVGLIAGANLGTTPRAARRAIRISPVQGMRELRRPFTATPR